MHSYTVLKKAETQSALIEVCSDKIVRVLFKKEVEINARELKNLFDNYNDMTEGVDFAFIYHSEDGTANLNGEAKKFAKLNPNYFHKSCVAVVVKSLAQRIMANFYLKTVRSGTPYQVFNTIIEAEKWCLDLLKEA